MTSRERRIQQLVYDCQEYIDTICQSYIEEVATDIYDNEGISINETEQEELYHEIYDAILLGVK